jgi:Holliday junction resolvasome RuvABC DNA-binding subunit
VPGSAAIGDHVFVDWANTKLGAHNKGVDLQVGRLIQFVESGSVVITRVAGGAGDMFSAAETQTFRQRQYHTFTHQGRKEYFVDQMVCLHILQSVIHHRQARDGSTIKLLTGDGNNCGDDNQISFFSAVGIALNEGFKVTLYAWKASLNRRYATYTSRFADNLSIVLLDDHPKLWRSEKTVALQPEQKHPQTSQNGLPKPVSAKPSCSTQPEAGSPHEADDDSDTSSSDNEHDSDIDSDSDSEGQPKADVCIFNFTVGCRFRSKCQKSHSASHKSKFKKLVFKGTVRIQGFTVWATPVGVVIFSFYTREKQFVQQQPIPNDGEYVVNDNLRVEHDGGMWTVVCSLRFNSWRWKPCPGVQPVSLQPPLVGSQQPHVQPLQQSWQGKGKGKGKGKGMGMGIGIGQEVSQPQPQPQGNDARTGKGKGNGKGKGKGKGKGTPGPPNPGTGGFHGREGAAAADALQTAGGVTVMEEDAVCTCEWPDAVRTLLAMGFPADKALQAVNRAKGDVQAAVAAATDDTGEADIADARDWEVVEDDAIRACDWPDVVHALLAMGFPADTALQAANSAKGDLQAAVDTAADAATVIEDGSQNGIAEVVEEEDASECEWPDLVHKLLTMGFPAHKAREAANRAQGNLEAAVEHLL